MNGVPTGSGAGDTLMHEQGRGREERRLAGGPSNGVEPSWQWGGRL
jgi:hypothetical protein